MHTPTTLFTHPLRLFHSTCQTVIHLSRSPLSKSLPHTGFIFSPSPTSLCLIVSITLLCHHERSYSFVFLKKNTILHIAYYECCTCIRMWYSGSINASQDFGFIEWTTVRNWSEWQRCANSKGIKAPKVFVTFVHWAVLHWQRVTTLSISGTGVYDNPSKKWERKCLLSSNK